MDSEVVRVPRRGESFTLLQWSVGVGDEVHEGQKLVTLRGENGSCSDVTSRRSGTVKRLDVKVEEKARSGDVLCEIEFCPHSVVFGGLCTLCGTDLSLGHFAQDKTSADRVNVAYESNLMVSQEEAQKSEESRAQRLLERRMLSLVLDLDHTLLHATDDLRAEAALHDDQSPPTPGTNRVSPKHHRGVHSLRLDNTAAPLYVKLRPGLGTFLRHVSKKFELHIYTMGTRAYADAIAKIIDPGKDLFRGRVTSRDDFEEGSLNQKNLRRVFPCDDTMVLILDDREDVWLEEGTKSLPNLIRARPYHFFKDLHEAYDRSSATGSATTPPNSAPSQNSTVPNTSAAAPGVDAAVQLKQASRGDGEKKHEMLPPPPPSSCTANGQSANGLNPPSDGQKALTVPAADVTADTPDDIHMDLTARESIAELLSATPVKGSGNEIFDLVQQWWAGDARDQYHLHRLMVVLEEIHRRFFERVNCCPAMESTKVMSRSPVDVKEVVGEFRREVLRGCHVAFTGVFPSNVKPEDTDLWQLAVRYGAVCYPDLCPEVTHLIVDSERGTRTEKAKRARTASAVFCVTPSFLESSAADFKRASEIDHSAFPEDVMSILGKALPMTLEAYRKRQHDLHQKQLRTQHVHRTDTMLPVKDSEDASDRPEKPVDDLLKHETKLDADGTLHDARGKRKRGETLLDMDGS